MIPRILDKSNLGAFVAALLKDHQVVGPVCKEPQWDQSSPDVRPAGLYAFAEIHSPEELAVPFPNTILSPKKYAYPQCETLVHFGPSGAKMPEVDKKPTVIFGAHPCDIHGLAISDKTMGSDNTDPYYVERRKMLTVIGMDCAEPCDGFQFCRDMGSLPCKSGYDLFLVPLADHYYVEVGTEKGRKLVADSELFRPAGPDDHHAKQEHDQTQEAAFPLKIPCDTKYLPDLLDESYDSLVWEAASRPCFGCGTCTNVCPACYCFDVTDDIALDGSGGTRDRRWDSCMLRGFAQVADGHNFRPSPAERLRHRVMRKGKLIFEKFGIMGCTGCGRCDRSCVSGISILQVYQQLAEGVVVTTK